MTMTKDYAYHPDIMPAHVTYRELARWGEDHPDLWVRKLAEIVDVVDSELKFTDSDSLEDYLSNHSDRMKDLKNDLRWAQDYLEEADIERNKAITQLKALQLDMSRDEQALQVAHLKERIYNAIIDRDEVKSQMVNLRSNYDALQKSYKELESKYNTWLAIAT